MTAPAPRTADSPPVARLRGPAELAAALPHLLGFVPTESLVVVTLRGDGRRVGLTMRLDLPPRAHDEAVVADVVERVVASGAGSALAVVCTQARDQGGLPRARLVRRLRSGLRRAGLDAPDALLVRDGRWWSYVCDDDRCCPRAGTPVPTPDGAPGLALVAAHATLDGRVVLPSRTAVVAGLAPPGPKAELGPQLARARAARAEQVRQAGRAAAGRESLRAWRDAVAAAPRRAPDDVAAAALVVALDDVAVRDEVLGSALDDDERLLWLLLELAARTPSPDDAAVCTLLGWTAHLRGDGARAGIALDRALASRPGLALAQLSRQALDAQLPPRELRTLLRASRAAVHRAHPWTRP